MWNRRQIVVVGVLWLCAAGSPALAQKVVEGERYRITRAASPIAIDGDLSDAGWHDALRIERWYEISPGDNTAPVVRSVGYLTYDDKFFYAGFEFDDPGTTHVDGTVVYKDYGTGFRADDGFVPQVGFRETYGEAGWAAHPQNFAKRIRWFLIADRQVERDGGRLILNQVSPGFGMDTLLNGFIRLRYQNDRIRAGDATFPRRQFVYTANFSPSRRFAGVGIDGYVGEDVDFTNIRPGRGGVVNLNETLNPTDLFVKVSYAFQH